MDVALPNPERSSAPRHLMSLPVTFPGGTGLTRDVSSAGVYFLSERSFEEGQRVSLTLTLEHSSPDGPIDPGTNYGLGFAKAS